MKKRKGFTLIELIVIVAIIAVLLGYLLPPLSKTKHIAQRVICGTNLKVCGTAISAYANEYDSNFPQLPGTGLWSEELGFDYFLEKPNFKPDGAQYNASRTITASWYLLVKYEDIAPKSFICPSLHQEEFDGKNPQKRDIKSLWDFGPEPYKHISYVMHNPYGQFPGDYKRSADFAVAADMSPYFENGDIIQNPKETALQKKNDPNYPYLNQMYNAFSHSTEGQNVLYADGHNSWESRPDVGVRNDNIYTYWRITANEDPNELNRRIGRPPTGRNPENDAKDQNDSFLAI